MSDMSDNYELNLLLNDYYDDLYIYEIDENEETKEPIIRIFQQKYNGPRWDNIW